MVGNVFISYRRTHAPVIDAIVDSLINAEIDVFLDRSEISELEDFPIAIRDAIKRAHAVLIWWSKDYTQSTVCLDELRLAWRAAAQGGSAGDRIWIVNPETKADHIWLSLI